MSTFLYGSLSRAREEAPQNQSTDQKPPGVKTYLDAFAALVPAEVLAVHATILQVTTDTEGEGDDAVTTITEPGTLEWVFWALIALSVLLFFGGLQRKPAWWDIPSALIPPAALVGWMMLVQPSAFDAVVGDLSDANRTAIAVIAAVVLGAIATALAKKRDAAPAA